MSRLIDADVLKQGINKVSTHWLNEWSTLGVLAMVDKQPTVDAVPVCRCKDCKYGKKYNETQYQCDRLYGEWFEDDDFCSYGERKGGDE